MELLGGIRLLSCNAFFICPLKSKVIFLPMRRQTQTPSHYMYLAQGEGLPCQRRFLLSRPARQDPTSKSLVFSQYNSSLAWLKHALPKRGFGFRTLTGNMSRKQRTDALQVLHLHPLLQACAGPRAPVQRYATVSVMTSRAPNVPVPTRQCWAH